VPSASALYQKAVQEGPAFMGQYDRMLTATTVSSVEAIGQLAGLDLTQKETWLEGMDSFGPFVKEFEGLVEELA